MNDERGYGRHAEIVLPAFLIGQRRFSQQKSWSHRKIEAYVGGSSLRLKSGAGQLRTSTEVLAKTVETNGLQTAKKLPEMKYRGGGGNSANM